MSSKRKHSSTSNDKASPKRRHTSDSSDDTSIDPNTLETPDSPDPLASPDPKISKPKTITDILSHSELNADNTHSKTPITSSSEDPVPFPLWPNFRGYPEPKNPSATRERISSWIQPPRSPSSRPSRPTENRPPASRFPLTPDDYAKSEAYKAVLVDLAETLYHSKCEKYAVPCYNVLLARGPFRNTVTAVLIAHKEDDPSDFVVLAQNKRNYSTVHEAMKELLSDTEMAMYSVLRARRDFE